MIKTVIVDDVQESRNNVERLLRFESDIQIVGSVGSGREAIDLVRDKQPDIVLMDVNMPGIDGIAATREIVSKRPNTGVVMMSVLNEPDVLRRSMLAGAREFLSCRLANGDSTILLAMNDAQGIGFTQLYPGFSSVAMHPLWILNDLFVDPDVRRSGVGRQLLEAAVEFARSTSAVRLVLATGVENHEAQALYVQQGWELESEFLHYNFSLSGT